MSGSAVSSARAWWWAWSGALLGLAAGVLAFAPAQWLADGIAQASHQQVVLHQAQGTLWNGSARLTLSGGAGSQDAVDLPGTLHWQLRPSWNALNLALSADCCTPQAMQWQWRPTGWGAMQLALSDHQSHWPAAVLTGLGTPWNTLQPQGQLLLSTRDLTLQWAQGRLRVNGTCTLDAQAISSRLSTLQPMGSYRLTLTGGASTSVTLQTLEGSLELSGQGQWLGARLHFEGEARAAPERIDALSNLLNIIGRRDGARSLIKVG